MDESAFAKLVQTYKIPIILGVCSIGLIALSLILLVKSTQTTSPIVFSEEASVAGIVSGTIHIDIEGAIVNPGVYQLPGDSRVEDAIVAAGGLSDKADAEKIAGAINRAAKVVDGAKLYIPKTGDTSLSGWNPANDNFVSINAASQSELETLAGIGPVTAQKIIAGRPYQTLEELVAKKAVGQSVFEKIKNQLAL